MRISGIAVIAAGLVLAGCQSEAEPAPPPPREDALTTTSAPAGDLVPTTSAPPDNVAATSAAPTTEAAETDTSEPPESSGPPELPPEAKEDSEAGAEAFALHYIDTINYTSMYPEVGLLEPLGSDDCLSCSNHEDAVAYMVEHGESVEVEGLEVQGSLALHRPADSEATVRVHTVQVEQAVTGADGTVVEEIPRMEATLVLDLTWVDAWLVQEIRVDTGEQ